MFTRGTEKENGFHLMEHKITSKFLQEAELVGSIVFILKAFEK